MNHGGTGHCDVSVIIPTYDRAEELRGTLRTLAAQDFSPERFEVIVADDGSHDHTRDVVERESWPMPVHYVYQEDRGYRAGQARNLGAARAEGQVLVFLDSGMLASRSFVSGHFAAHAAARAKVAVIGYVYGYNNDPNLHLKPTDLERDVDELIAEYRSEGKYLDSREPNFQALKGDLGHSRAPWIFCWSGNLSLRADVFAAVGGFDPDFVGWSGEDVELGVRLHEHGLSFLIGRDIAALEIPHERDLDALLPSYRKHSMLTLRKHVAPAVEVATICWAHELDDRLAELTEAAQRRVAAVTDMIDRGDAAHRRSRDDASHYGDRVVVVGADALPEAPEAALCLEPDHGLASRMRVVLPQAPASFLPLFGFRTLQNDGAFSDCLLSASLRHYPSWAIDLITAEAERVATRVRWAAPDGGEQNHRRVPRAGS